jgi:lauroyl/myristoyl acyltransferase
VRGFLTYISYRLLEMLTGPLPPRIGYRLARRAGSLLYSFQPRLRCILSHNIRHVLGPEAGEDRVQILVRQACVNIAKGHYELFRVSRLTTDEIKQLVRIEGMEHMYRALAQGKGAVVISAHFGNVDLVAQVPLAYGLPIVGPAEHTKPERLFRFALRLRQSHGLRLIPADGPLVELFRALKRGEIVALPCDRSIADNSRDVDFFGSPARLPDGPLRVALRTGAALIPAFALRLLDDTFLVQVEPALELPRTGDREADVAAGMKMVVSVMEQYISRHPEQWLVAVPVWPMNQVAC